MRVNQVSVLLFKPMRHGVLNRIPSMTATALPSIHGAPQLAVSRLQTRSYVFVPTSWDEWKRLFVSRSQRRTILIKFFREHCQAVSSQWTSAKQKFVLQSDYYMPHNSKVRFQRWVRAKKRRTKIRAKSFVSAIMLKRRSKLMAVMGHQSQQRFSYSSRTATAATQFHNDSRAVAKRWREHGRVTARRWQEKMKQMYTRHMSSFQRRTQHPSLFQQHNSTQVTTTTSSASIASAPSLIQTVTLTEYSQADWFDADGYPLTSRDGDRFVNPWMSESTNGVKSLQYVWDWRVQRLQRTWRELGWKSFIPSIRLPWWNTSSLHKFHQQQYQHKSVMGPVPRSLSSNSSSSSSPQLRDRIRLTWIGHSTCLVEMAGVTVLTDPIFSHRASPIQYLPAGVPRHTPAACSIHDLPSIIDICLISHDHYDHLDKNSVLQLRSRVQLWVVPLGIKEWLRHHCHIPNEQIVELEWWESVALYHKNPTSTANKTAKPPATQYDYHGSPSSLHVGGTFHWPHQAIVSPDLQITCAPTQHWSCRSMWDRNTRLWCSWALYDKAARSSFYFGGDSGYPTEFPLYRQIGQRLGPFDLSALPIGAYEPSYFMQDAHVHPAEALKIHQDILSKRSVGIHWGSFSLAEEDKDEPPRKLQQAIVKEAQRTSNSHGSDHHSKNNLDFTVIGMGESIESLPRRLEHQVVMV